MWSIGLFLGVNYSFINSEVLRYRCLQGSIDLQNSFGKMHAASNRTNSNPVLALNSGRNTHALFACDHWHERYSPGFLSTDGWGREWLSIIRKYGWYVTLTHTITLKGINETYTTWIEGQSLFQNVKKTPYLLIFGAEWKCTLPRMSA